MTIEELKEKATASELTLIEQVQSLGIQKELKQWFDSLNDWVENNPPHLNYITNRLDETWITKFREQLKIK